VVLLSEVVNELKGLRFDLKKMLDAFPPNFAAIGINPSRDCDTEKNSKYRTLMRALSLTEECDLAKDADELLLQTKIQNWTFVWKEGMPEIVSYPRFQENLKDVWNINATILADGKGLADGFLYVSDIFNLRLYDGSYMAELKIEGKQPIYRFRIQGRTDLAVFHEGAVMTCGLLLWAIEVKSKIKFSSPADINRALREGVLQLIGMNADNPYTSPSVIVTAFMNQHYILYLEVDRTKLKFIYHLRVKKTESLAAAIAFVQERSKLCSITGKFATPPIPCNYAPPGKLDDDDDDDDEYYDDSNVQLHSAEELEAVEFVLEKKTKKKSI